MQEDDENEPITKKAKVTSKKDKSSKATEVKDDVDAGAPPRPKRRGKEKKANIKLGSEEPAGEDGSRPSGDEIEPPPKQTRPQRRAATSQKVVVKQSEDDTESANSDAQEDEAESKPKGRKKAAENSLEIKAKTLQKSKKIGSSKVSGSLIPQALIAHPNLDKSGR